MKRSRRRFLKVVATGTAATLVAPAAALAAVTRAPRAAPKPPQRPAPKPVSREDTALAAEIERQKKSVAQTLKVLREFPLANGEDLAFEFHPLKGGR